MLMTVTVLALILKSTSSHLPALSKLFGPRLVLDAAAGIFETMATPARPLAEALSWRMCHLVPSFCSTSIALKISSKSVVSALTSCRAMTSGECSITHCAKPFLKAALTPLTLMVTTERLVGMGQV